MAFSGSGESRTRPESWGQILEVFVNLQVGNPSMASSPSGLQPRSHANQAAILGDRDRPGAFEPVFIESVTPVGRSGLEPLTSRV